MLRLWPEKVTPRCLYAATKEKQRYIGRRRSAADINLLEKREITGQELKCTHVREARWGDTFVSSINSGLPSYQIAQCALIFNGALLMNTFTYTGCRGNYLSSEGNLCTWNESWVQSFALHCFSITTRVLIFRWTAPKSYWSSLLY